MSELWRAIPGYEGKYEASNEGRIRSLSRTVSRAGARSSFRMNGRILKLQQNHTDYMVVSLGKGKTRYVHQLVLLAFGYERKEGLECAHLDGYPSNNKLSNLKWVDALENARHRQVHGTIRRGSRSPLAKLTEADILRIRESFLFGGRMSSIAMAYGVDSATIHGIVHGKTWTHVR